MTTQNHSHPERRLGGDRRTRPTSPLSLSSLFGSRRAGRRATDAKIHYYVDLYSFRCVSVVLLTLMLSITDAFLTVKLLELGASELNPVMRLLLRLGPMPFLMIKYAVTAVSMALLLIHKNCCLFGERIGVKSILIGVPLLYGCLVAYELVLLL